jgi:hypothetical protein
VLDLRKRWPEIRVGLEEVQRKAPDDGWIPEDVYHALRSNAAHVVFLDGGFFIYQVLPGDDGAGLLFVWIIYGDLIANKSQIEEGIESLGRSLGVARIRFGSPRRWDAFGWAKLIGYVYEVKL